MAELSAREFEARYRELIQGFGREQANQGSVQCVGCRSCNLCTFCRDSEYLLRCHYCVACSRCTDSAHCRSSKQLISCSHCIDCETCTQSSYLERSMGLTDCNYCFGCVGLSGKDFHVLNEAYDRSTYFALVQRLSIELGGGRR
jgi:hypothetical protein